jgi:hypothetical protein
MKRTKEVMVDVVIRNYEEQARTYWHRDGWREGIKNVLRLQLEAKFGHLNLATTILINNASIKDLTTMSLSIFDVNSTDELYYIVRE